MKVIWTPEALDALEEIEAYVARDDPVAAIRLTDRLFDRTQPLEDQPRMGREVPEMPGSDLRELIERAYRIIYRIEGETVWVLTVQEGHRVLTPDLVGER